MHSLVRVCVRACVRAGAYTYARDLGGARARARSIIDVNKCIKSNTLSATVHNFLMSRVIEH
jgi:hypothetical protein